MAEIATNFPPQTYSSSFFLNSLTDEEKNVVANDSTGVKRSDNNTPLLDCFISTMSPSFLFLTILLIGPNWSDATECLIPNEDKTRTFNSIKEYQGNKVPFNFISADWEGSSVQFNCTTISALPKNVLITYDSKHIIKMKLSGKHIERIDEGAFTSLDCVHELLLDQNNITKLSKNAFQGLLHLTKLDLSNNKLEYLPDLVFANLDKLKILILSRNQIKGVQSLAFQNLELLENLDLEFNKLQTVTSDVFSPLNKLQVLSLAWNRFGDVQAEKWTNLSSLQNLNLAGNNMNHFDPSYNFSFEKSMKSLNLTYNSLTKLNVVALNRHLPNLTLIDLNGNPWFCDDLQNIVDELIASNIKVVSRNVSGSSVHGIACSDVPIYSTTTSISTSPAGSTTTDGPIYNISYIKRIVEKKIKEENEKIITSMGSLRSSLIVLFVVVLIFIVFEIAIRTNCWKIVYARIRGRNEMYLDSSNVENLRLLGR